MRCNQCQASLISYSGSGSDVECPSCGAINAKVQVSSSGLDATREVLMSAYKDNSDYIRHQDTRMWVLFAALIAFDGLLLVKFADPTTDRLVQTVLLVVLIAIHIVVFVATIRYVIYSNVRAIRGAAIEKEFNRIFPHADGQDDRRNIPLLNALTAIDEADQRAGPLYVRRGSVSAAICLCIAAVPLFALIIFASKYSNDDTKPAPQKTADADRIVQSIESVIAAINQLPRSDTSNAFDFSPSLTVTCPPSDTAALEKDLALIREAITKLGTDMDLKLATFDRHLVDRIDASTTQILNHAIDNGKLIDTNLHSINEVKAIATQTATGLARIENRLDSLAESSSKLKSQMAIQLVNFSSFEKLLNTVQSTVVTNNNQLTVLLESHREQRDDGQQDLDHQSNVQVQIQLVQILGLIEQVKVLLENNKQRTPPHPPVENSPCYRGH